MISYYMEWRYDCQAQDMGVSTLRSRHAPRLENLTGAPLANALRNGSTSVRYGETARGTGTVDLRIAKLRNYPVGNVHSLVGRSPPLFEIFAPPVRRRI